MGNQRFIASRKKKQKVNLSGLSWHDLRRFAAEKGVAVFGRGRAVIERDLLEVLASE